MQELTECLTQHAEYLGIPLHLRTVIGKLYTYSGSDSLHRFYIIRIHFLENYYEGCCLCF